jgi:hypothetical protein
MKIDSNVQKRACRHTESSLGGIVEVFQHPKDFRYNCPLRWIHFCHLIFLDLGEKVDVLKNYNGDLGVMSRDKFQKYYDETMEKYIARKKLQDKAAI